MRQPGLSKKKYQYDDLILDYLIIKLWMGVRELKELISISLILLYFRSGGINFY